MWEGVRMLRGCSIAAVPQLLVVVTTVSHCSYADMDKNFFKFTKEKNNQKNSLFREQQLLSFLNYRRATLQDSSIQRLINSWS